MKVKKLRKKIIISLLIILILGACEYCSVPEGERFTYRVHYTVEGNLASTIDITYIDEDNNSIPENNLSTPISRNFTREYDFSIGSEFYPSLNITTDLGAGESVTMTISWEDYKVNFEEEVLCTATIVGPMVGVDKTLHAGPLPP